jgi:hypothetical protein
VFSVGDGVMRLTIKAVSAPTFVQGRSSRWMEALIK